MCETNKTSFRYWTKTSKEKIVHNEYSFIPLHIMKKRAEQEPVALKFIEDINTKYKIPEDKDLQYTNGRLDKYVFEKAKPMIYYNPDELVKMIRTTVDKDRLVKIIAKLEAKKNDEIMSEFFPSLDTSDITPVSQSNIPGLQKESEADKVSRENRLLYESLDEEAVDYVGYPELQQKIKDHFKYRSLRYKYLHKSYKLEAVLDKLVHSPFKPSVRDVPSRKLL